MIEIASLLADGFARLDVPCQLAIDREPTPAAPDLLQLVVAPHEYFTLFLAPRLSPVAQDTAARHVFVLNVEQPGSQWFDLAAHFAVVGRGVFDISRDGVAEFRRRGVDAVHAPIGFLPELEHADAPALADRPIDVVFLGHHSLRREHFFARHAACFAAMDCRLVLTDPLQPRTADTPGYLAGSARQRLLRATKILLNVHSTERQYFESHRALLALANGCLLVSENSQDTRPFSSGRHFVSGFIDELPALCAQYATDAAASAGIVREGQRLAATELAIATTCRTLLAAVSPDAARADRGLAPDATMRAAVQSRLTAAIRARAAGEADWVATGNAAYRQSPPPAVTVAVTVYNYARVVEECVASVLAAAPVAGGVELVVVDDGSDDDSAGVVERITSAASLPSVVIRKRTNTGLADARNLAFEQARGKYVFVLDADNWIYPLCLRRLHDALADDGAVASYGLLCRFDDETAAPLGLLSTYAWNVEQLVRGPYIDAMAMFDRGAVLELGGYSTDLVEHGWFGWEDYDLWLRIAESGGRCTLVPNVVGAYRVHADSMIARTNRCRDTLGRYFQERFAGLARQYPGLDHYFGLPSAADRVQGDSSAAGQPPDAWLLRCHDLEREIRSLHQSMSWRLTAPLRWGFRVLTGRPH
jgi:hypothetical protein